MNESETERNEEIATVVQSLLKIRNLQGPSIEDVDSVSYDQKINRKDRPQVVSGINSAYQFLKDVGIKFPQEVEGDLVELLSFTEELKNKAEQISLPERQKQVVLIDKIIDNILNHNELKSFQINK